MEDGQNISAEQYFKLVKERDNYKAVLVAMEFNSIDEIGEQDIALCLSLGNSAKLKIKNMKDRLDVFELLTVGVK